jgi:Cytochrome c554 and c-prime
MDSIRPLLYRAAMAGFTWKRLSLEIGVPALLMLLASGVPSSLLAQFATSDRVSQPGFWPTQTIYPRDTYAGANACASCHKQTFADAQQTSMARTAMLAGESGILRSNPDLGFSHNSYQYDIRTADGVSIYTVMNGPKQESAQLKWAFGTDRVAQCFGCHTTASGMGSNFDESRLIPGVSCEACHGPGKAHIDEMEGLAPETGARKPIENTRDTIFNPGKLTPEESVDFCGACHGSYWDISLSGATGVNTVRFQPFRLEESKCWNKNDPRLTCIACHDPHKQVDAVAADYDHVCLSCHLTRMNAGQPVSLHSDRTHPGAACPVATRNCTICHMPEVYVPVMHQTFPDHRIRIVRAGEPFPD